MTRRNKNWRPPVDIIDFPLYEFVVYCEFGFVNPSLAANIYNSRSFPLALYRSWSLLIYNVKLNGKAQMSSKKIWRKSGVKGDKMKVKASRSARKSVRKKERYAREMQRNCHRLAVGEKEKKRVLREGYKGFRRGQGAGRKRVIRMEIQVYEVSLCSWFITIRLCHTDVSLSLFLSLIIFRPMPMPNLHLFLQSIYLHLVEQKHFSK